MLNRYRWAVEALLDRIVGPRVPLGPNSLTAIALLTSLLAPLVAWLGAGPLLVALVLLSSAALDVLDGYVARRKGSATRFGAFLDSTSDRVADAAYTAAMMLCGVLEPAAALLLLAAEYLVSYARARAEGLGLQLKGVGLMERGERVLLKALALAAYAFSEVAGRVIAWILIALTIFTVLQRVCAVNRGLAEQ